MPTTLMQRLRPPAAARRPGRHLGLEWRRPIQQDKPLLRQLTRVTERQNEVVRYTPLGQVDALVDEALDGRYADALVGVDTNGKVQAFGLVRLYREDREVARAELYAATMPKWRGRGIGRALLTWQDSRARQLLVEQWGADATLPARISNVVEAHQRDRRQLYAAAGYCPDAYIGVYLADLTGPIVKPPARAPQVVKWDEQMRVQVRALHLAKAQAQGASHAQARRWWMRVNADLDPQLSFIALEDGTVSAFALVCRHSDDWHSAERTDASIEAFGPAYGIALAAVFAHTLAQAKAAGLRGISTESRLNSVDETDPNLEALGFSGVGVRMVYTLDL